MVVHATVIGQVERNTCHVVKDDVGDLKIADVSIQTDPIGHIKVERSYEKVRQIGYRPGDVARDTWYHVEYEDADKNEHNVNHPCAWALGCQPVALGLIHCQST